MPRLKFDEIGYWSELKLKIVEEYIRAYTTIFASKKQEFLVPVYIDAFAGAGIHVRKGSGEPVRGSPLRALEAGSPFKEYHLIDLDRSKTEHLKKLVAGRLNVRIYEGDCNGILVSEILPTIRYESYRRALCLLDPYGLHLNWEVIRLAGQLGTVDIFLNFPIADMNRNVIWRNPQGVDAADIERMDAFWGDHSWRDVAYDEQKTLFGDPLEEKVGNREIAAAFHSRLQQVAGFKFVPDPLPMRNTRGAIVYYMFFASANKTADRIARGIFTKYQGKGVR